MGHWISVYTDEMETLRGVVRSKSQVAAEQAIERYKAKAGAHAKPATMDAIRQIVDGSYRPGDQPDGPTLIYAFEHLCRLYSRQFETVEIYVDEAAFPEIFSFVWNSKSDPFELPRSHSRSPACSHWNNVQVNRFYSLFQSLDMQELTMRTDSDYAEEIESLCKVLKTACEQGQGVFVFFNE